LDKVSLSNKAVQITMVLLRKIFIFPFLVLTLLFSCNKTESDSIADLSIIFINDQHGQIDNFGKLKHLIDQEKKEGNVIVACSGDMFSGNPVVDIYEPSGYPMIELMNHCGFDVAVLGNHEFDYGQDVLADRMEQAGFEWICANVDMQDSEIPQPLAYTSILRGDLKVCFLGLLETNGKPDLNIPSTHPLKVDGIHFDRPEEVVANYSELKGEEGADLLIALTHLGHTSNKGNLGDFQLAEQFPYFDLIIGGHTNPLLDTMINGIPVFQAGNYLNYAGLIDITVKNKKVESIEFTAVDLNNYPESDPGIENMIDQYQQDMEELLNEEVGYSEIYHNRNQLGCFYTEALRSRLGADLSFQNYGGIRHDLDEGPITVREVYEIDPFNNRAMLYEMTGWEIKNFMLQCSQWQAFSGIDYEVVEEELILYDQSGQIIRDDQVLKVAINDYIPSVEDALFPSDGKILPYTTAEALIYFLKYSNSIVHYPDCDRYFYFE
jgi:5'-nucleotidase/UDP-sugar diphosphatase